MVFTVTVDTAVPVQAPVVPVTVYVVVVVNACVVGFDVDAKPLVQVYDVAPLALKLAVSPSQIAGEFTFTTKFGFTDTVATAVPVQPLVVPVTVYVVVVVSAGVVGFDVDAKPFVQVYDVAPLALNAAVCPLQIFGELTIIFKFGCTDTVATAVPVQPLVVPVTVYVVVFINAGVVGFDVADKPFVHV